MCDKMASKSASALSAGRQQADERNLAADLGQIRVQCGQILDEPSDAGGQILDGAPHDGSPEGARALTAPVLGHLLATLHLAAGRVLPSLGVGQHAPLEFSAALVGHPGAPVVVASGPSSVAPALNLCNASGQQQQQAGEREHPRRGRRCNSSHSELRRRRGSNNRSVS